MEGGRGLCPQGISSFGSPSQRTSAVPRGLSITGQCEQNTKPTDPHVTQLSLQNHRPKPAKEFAYKLRPTRLLPWPHMSCCCSRGGQIQTASQATNPFSGSDYLKLIIITIQIKPTKGPKSAVSGSSWQSTEETEEGKDWLHFIQNNVTLISYKTKIRFLLS